MDLIVLGLAMGLALATAAAARDLAARRVPVRIRARAGGRRPYR